MVGMVKFHLVTWNKVCCLISYGELGGFKMFPLLIRRCEVSGNGDLERNRGNFGVTSLRQNMRCGLKSLQL